MRAVACAWGRPIPLPKANLIPPDTAVSAQRRGSRIRIDADETGIDRIGNADLQAGGHGSIPVGSMAALGLGDRAEQPCKDGLLA